MDQDLIARVSTVVDARIDAVWDALVTPDAIKQYMFGTTVSSDWAEGSPITWSGEWKGEPYQDKGVILELTPGRTLRTSHFSPLSGVPDRPENYHTVAIDPVLSRYLVPSPAHARRRAHRAPGSDRAAAASGPAAARPPPSWPSARPPGPPDGGTRGRRLRPRPRRPARPGARPPFLGRAEPA
ncbi:MAG: hypothetical protein EPN50_02750 [Chloroflexota bacterium]|nr:MAG: hypothetical protein EPN50_02750 [Chloroflexota bacterium]